MATILNQHRIGGRTISLVVVWNAVGEHHFWVRVESPLLFSSESFDPEFPERCLGWDVKPEENAVRDGFVVAAKNFQMRSKPDCPEGFW